MAMFTLLIKCFTHQTTTKCSNTNKTLNVEYDENVFCFQTSPCLSSRRGSSSEPNSLVSSPSSSPLAYHRPRHQNGHHRHHLKDGYLSLERLNRRPRVNKSSLEKLYLQRASLQTMTITTRNDESSSLLVTRSCSGDSSSDECGEGLSDNTEFIRNRKERSTVLVRRFFKNNQKVSICKIPILLVDFKVIYSM